MYMPDFDILRNAATAAFSVAGFSPLLILSLILLLLLDNSYSLLKSGFIYLPFKLLFSYLLLFYPMAVIMRPLVAFLFI